MMVRYILQMLPQCFFNRTGRVFPVNIPMMFAEALNSVSMSYSK